MGLLFNDNHIKCNNCSSKRFEEIRTFGIEPITTKDKQNKFKTIQPQYAIKCIECGQIMNISEKSLLINEGE